jgi:hypothetical protein
MAHNSSKTTQRNWKNSDSPPNNDESWKTRPSAETASDEGQNEKLTREHQREENAPGLKLKTARKAVRHR